jgi:hypothetical protein
LSYQRLYRACLALFCGFFLGGQAALAFDGDGGSGAVASSSFADDLGTKAEPIAPSPNGPPARLAVTPATETATAASLTPVAITTSTATPLPTSQNELFLEAAKKADEGSRKVVSLSVITMAEAVITMPKEKKQAGVLFDDAFDSLEKAQALRAMACANYDSLARSSDEFLKLKCKGSELFYETELLEGAVADEIFSEMEQKNKIAREEFIRRVLAGRRDLASLEEGLGLTESGISASMEEAKELSGEERFAIKTAAKSNNVFREVRASLRGGKKTLLRSEMGLTQREPASIAPTQAPQKIAETKAKPEEKEEDFVGLKAKEGEFASNEELQELNLFDVVHFKYKQLSRRLGLELTTQQTR